MTITTLRPSSTTASTGWTPTPSGTAHGVTSDDSDSTYALWTGASNGSALVLATPVDAPPVGERRHQVRLRARGEDGDAWWAVRLASGQLVGQASAQFTTSPTTVTGSWGFGAPPDGSTVLSAYVAGQSSGVKITELYLDMDSRAAPTFTAQVVNGAGTVTTTVSDTATPTLRASAVDTDDLPSRQYRYWVTSGSTIVWDSGIVSGQPADLMTPVLDNGAYTAHFQIWSTLGANTAYASDEETVAFTVALDLIAQPDAPTINQIDGTPFYLIQTCAPFVGDLDGDQGYIEIQRVDCPVDGVPTAVTSLAMLGPLVSDECSTWTDYTLPRSGIGGSCTHDPEQCCSYYRARTVGRINGAVVISDWSDAFDQGIPTGMIVMWPSTDATIPQGWRRTAELDGRYLKGIPDAATQPGATGGAATHAHPMPTHVHDETHSHTAPANTGAGSGSVAAVAGGPTPFAVATTHTHTLSALASAVVSSGATSPNATAVPNDPARLEVVFIESDGSPAGVPDSALAFMPDISVSGWSTYAAGTDRFIKGAAPGADGGTTAASATASHVHSVNAHTHTGTGHTHTSPNTGSVASNTSLFAGPTQVMWQSTHTHPVTVTPASTAALAGSTAADSGSAASADPPYRNVRLNQNTLGVPDLPIGLICAWRGSIGTIPDNWQLCDGTNGTPDLFGRYPRAATASLGGTGGDLNPHTHTSPSHTHTTTAHSHAITTSGPIVNGEEVQVSSPTFTASTLGHTHSVAASQSVTPAVGSSTSGTLQDTTTEPPFEEVAFIQMMEEPTAPPEPETFCLTWDEDEHLIRTTSADGPIWTPVLGRFTWTRDRPFTSSIGVMGSTFVTSAAPGGRNLAMTAAVESDAALAQLRAVLARPLVLISPSDLEEVWAAPVAESVTVIKVGRIRQVVAEFIATGPEPAPQLADMGS